MTGRYVRTDVKDGPLEAMMLTADSVPDVLAFLGAAGHSWEPVSGILSVQLPQGAVLNIRAGSYVIRDEAGHVTHMPAEEFTETFKPADTDAEVAA